MKRVFTVLGARPQFIKASVVSAALAELPDVCEIVVHTGQHFDANMSDVFFDDLGMGRPAHHLGIHGGGHGEMTGRMLAALEAVMQDERPDVVLVYGDTNSTLAGALAAAKLHIPVAHVEAGLRSFNRRMPEEINRVLTDQLSHLLFTPTDAATENLAKEGIDAKGIIQVGDVMYDVALHHGQRAARRDRPAFAARLEAGGYVLATIHRQENTDDRAKLAGIAAGLKQAAVDLPVVWPLHPRTRQALDRAGLLESLSPDVMLIDPLGYLDMLWLERHAALIVTDSGGVQKEAFFHQVPCVTVRDETEWVELVQSGWNRLADAADPSAIREAIHAALGKPGQAVSPYGDGHAAGRIAAALALMD